MALCVAVALAFKPFTAPHDVNASVDLEAAIKLEANIWKTKIHPAASRTKDASLLLQIAQCCERIRNQISQNCDQSVARALTQTLLVREGDIKRYWYRLRADASKRQAPGVLYWQAHAAGSHGLALHKLGYTEAARQQLVSAAAFYSLSLWRHDPCLASHASLSYVVRTACSALGQAETLAQSKQSGGRSKDPLAGPTRRTQYPALALATAGRKRKRPSDPSNSSGGAMAATTSSSGSGSSIQANADEPAQAVQPHRDSQIRRKYRTVSSARGVARQGRLVRRLESTGLAQLRSERSTTGSRDCAATRPAGALRGKAPEPAAADAVSARVKPGVAGRTMWKLLQLRMLEMVASASGLYQGLACSSSSGGDDRAVAKNRTRAATVRHRPPYPYPKPFSAKGKRPRSPNTHGSSRDGGDWAPSRGMLLYSRVTRDFRRLLDAGYMQPGQALTILVLLLGHGLRKYQGYAGCGLKTSQPGADNGGSGSDAPQQTGPGVAPPTKESAGTQSMREMLLRAWMLLASRVTAHSRAALLHVRPRDVLETSAETGASSKRGLDCEQGLHEATEPKAKRARIETRTAASMGVVAQAIGRECNGTGAEAGTGTGAGAGAGAEAFLSASRASGNERLEAACKWMAVARVCAECALRHGPALRLALAGSMHPPSRGGRGQAKARARARAQAAAAAAAAKTRVGTSKSGRVQAIGSKGDKGSRTFTRSPSGKPIPPRMRTHRDLLGMLLREVAALCKAIGSRTWLDVGPGERGAGLAAKASSAATAPSAGQALGTEAGWNRPVLEEDVLLWDVSWMQRHGNEGLSPAASALPDYTSLPAAAAPGSSSASTPASVPISEAETRDIGFASVPSKAAASGCWRPTLGCRPALPVDLEGCPPWIREGYSPLDRLRLHGQSGDGQSGWDAFEGMSDLRVRGWQFLRCGEVLHRECRQGEEQEQALAGALAIKARGR